MLSSPTASIRSGSLLRLFSNQNVQSHVDVALTITGATSITGGVSAGATSITIAAATTLTGTLKKGDIITITDSVTGLTDPYACTADAVASGNAITFVPSPAVRVGHLAASTWAATKPRAGCRPV